MRIVIDMQGAQSSASRDRGIGRYTSALVMSMLRNNATHEIILALNAAFPESIEAVRESVFDVLPLENIKVWSAVSPISFIDSEHTFYRKTAELIREAFIADLNPDVVLVTSLFEGLGDDTVSSIGRLAVHYPVGVVLYDLIPFIHRKPYLENPVVEAWYLEKIEHLKNADFYLGISESSCQEGIKYLGFNRDTTVNISTDADPQFKKINITEQQEQTLREKYQLNQSFVMYTGGIDHRKNIEGLIRAFAKLPQNLRDSYQLAIVCSIQLDAKESLTKLVLQVGLKQQQVVFTDYVSEKDLISLYNLTSLFVFPSWHEGFGLPLLEAMRCGAPSISSNLSSLPEVIGWQKAQFDPHNEIQMSSLIEKGLTDAGFRQHLIDNAEKRSQLFSWDLTAQLGLAAMEKAVVNKKAEHGSSKPTSLKPKLAYISPLPPEQSGISDYSAELLPFLEEFYDIDVIVSQENIENQWIINNCPIRSVEWFANNANSYDRILYHFGNSHFHQHMFDLLHQFPGVVVLHDFYLSGIVHYMDATDYMAGCFSSELFKSHGYHACKVLKESSDVSDVMWKFPASLSVIQDSKGMIVHSPNSLKLAEKWYGLRTDHWSVIPHLRVPETQEKRFDARKALNIPDDAFVVCSFGGMGPTKLNDRLLTVWLESNLAEDKKCYLVFVGQNHPGEYGADLLARINRAKLQKRIVITGWVDQKTYHQYLAAADIGVQLRRLSRGETSGTVLDCMNYSLPTIVNANGSMADLDPKTVWLLSDEFEDVELIEALETLYNSQETRSKLANKARKVILERHDPATCALTYKKAIESAYSNAGDLDSLLSCIVNELPSEVEESQLALIASALSKTFPAKNRQKQIFVDISELVRHDSKSGNQRVVRSILVEWLLAPPDGFRVEPVYATADHSYRYARQFTAGFLEIDENFIDEPIDASSGDIFLALDLQPHVLQARQSYLQELRNSGVVVKTVVYDLLPVLLPDVFVDGAKALHQGWLETTAKFDGVICISKSVADEYSEWLKQQNLSQPRGFSIDWFHLGADIENSKASTGLPPNAETVIKKIQSKPSFLMVGTIEPRKGHAQTLKAFEVLWKQGEQINLVIIGKQGWMVEEIVENIKQHPEHNKRLIWLEGVSDAFLEQVYSASTCLIAASEGEGFGLPLIEAAQKNKPIIARDIPVFREVAGEYAYYFDNNNSPECIATAIKKWMALYQKNQHPNSVGMPYLTWEESAQSLLTNLIN
jgi:glycosyltransferase involved in cell wall biosynthesis